MVSPKDLPLFFGPLSNNACYLKWRHIRDALGKKPRMPVSAWEFAEYIGIKVDEVIRLIN